MSLEGFDEDNPVDPIWLEQHASEYARGWQSCPPMDELFHGMSDEQIRYLDEDDRRLFDALEQVLGYTPTVVETCQWLHAYRKVWRRRRED